MKKFFAFCAGVIFVVAASQSAWSLLPLHGILPAITGIGVERPPGFKWNFELSTATDSTFDAALALEKVVQKGSSIPQICLNIGALSFALERLDVEIMIATPALRSWENFKFDQFQAIKCFCDYPLEQFSSNQPRLVHSKNKSELFTNIALLKKMLIEAAKLPPPKSADKTGN